MPPVDPGRDDVRERRQRRLLEQDLVVRTEEALALQIGGVGYASSSTRAVERPVSCPSSSSAWMLPQGDVVGR